MSSAKKFDLHLYVPDHKMFLNLGGPNYFSVKGRQNKGN